MMTWMFCSTQRLAIPSNLRLPYHLTDFNCMFAQQQSEINRLRQPLGTTSQIVGNAGENPNSTVEIETKKKSERDCIGSTRSTHEAFKIS